MDTSHPTKVANGFKGWSVAHKPAGNDDDQPGGATPIALPVPTPRLPTVATGSGPTR